MNQINNNGTDQDNSADEWFGTDDSSNQSQDIMEQASPQTELDKNDIPDNTKIRRKKSGIKKMFRRGSKSQSAKKTKLNIKLLSKRQTVMVLSVCTIGGLGFYGYSSMDLLSTVGASFDKDEAKHSNSEQRMSFSDINKRINEQVHTELMRQNATMDGSLKSRLKSTDDKITGINLSIQSFGSRIDFALNQLNTLSSKIGGLETKVKQLESVSPTDNGEIKTLIAINKVNVSNLKDTLNSISTELHSSTNESTKQIATLTEKIKNSIDSSAGNSKKISDMSEKLNLINAVNNKENYRYETPKKVTYDDDVSISNSSNDLDSNDHNENPMIVPIYYFDGIYSDGYKLVKVSTGQKFKARINTKINNYGYVTDFIEGPTLSTSYLKTSTGYEIVSKEKLDGLD